MANDDHVREGYFFDGVKTGRASCNIYLDAKSDCYRMKDFGNDLYSSDCFWFAATMQGFDAHTEFMQVLETIIRDL